MFTSIIRTIISTEFQINPLTITLFFGSGPKSPPPLPTYLVKSQNAVVSRVKYSFFSVAAIVFCQEKETFPIHLQFRSQKPSYCDNVLLPTIQHRPGRFTLYCRNTRILG